ncbi:helix-turn-helix domain-containing protein [Streptomyces sp. NPDC090306]|uniref:helix-turn-helix domain-containing protein n=1 Tax=unclassified Streptomyces TaxID=2593676 RepID=UPI0036E763B9
MKNDADHIEEFAAWIESVMRDRGYEIDSPRGGGKSKLAEDAGVHRAAVTRLLQRQSMPDLDTMRGLSRALDVPVREVLIRSGKLTEDDLPQAPAPPVGRVAPGPEHLSAEQAAAALGIPEHLRSAFVQITEQLRGAPGTVPGTAMPGAAPGAEEQARP